MVDQPNTDPRTLDAKSFDLKLDIAKHRCVVDFCINGGPGKIEELVKAGVAAIGEIFAYEHSDAELQKILKSVEEAGALPTIHAEDGRIIKELTESLKHLHEPDVYSKARPATAEAAAIEKAISWANRLHVCHISTFRGLELVRAAKTAASGKKAEL